MADDITIIFDMPLEIPGVGSWDVDRHHPGDLEWFGANYTRLPEHGLRFGGNAAIAPDGSVYFYQRGDAARLYCLAPGGPCTLVDTQPPADDWSYPYQLPQFFQTNSYILVVTEYGVFRLRPGPVALFPCSIRQVLDLHEPHTGVISITGRDYPFDDDEPYLPTPNSVQLDLALLVLVPAFVLELTESYVTFVQEGDVRQPHQINRSAVKNPQALHAAMLHTTELLLPHRLAAPLGVRFRSDLSITS